MKNMNRLDKNSKKTDKAVVYNIRYGTGRDMNYHFPVPFAGCFRNVRNRFDLIADWICEQSPDIVGLIEADSGSYRMNGESQPKIMSKQLYGCYNFCCKYFPDDSIASLPLLSKQGNAIVSSKPGKFSRKFFPVGVKKAIIVQEYRDYCFFLVHMSIGKNTRSLQIKMLSEMVKELKLPVVIAGDWNNFNGLDELRPLKDIGLKICEFYPTWPTGRPKFNLDFVVHSPSIGIEPIIPQKVSLSDHLPIVFTITA